MRFIFLFLRGRRNKSIRPSTNDKQETKVKGESLFRWLKSGKRSQTGGEAASPEDAPAPPRPSDGLIAEPRGPPSLSADESSTSTKGPSSFKQCNLDAAPKTALRRPRLRRVAGVADLKVLARQNMPTLDGDRLLPMGAPAIGRATKLAKV